jgi:hypothetical protein
MTIDARSRRRSSTCTMIGETEGVGRTKQAVGILFSERSTITNTALGLGRNY